MMRIVTALVAIVGVVAGALWWPAEGSQAQTAPSGVRLAQATPPADPAEPRRRPLRRLPIYPRHQGDPDGVYPRYNPGPNAVRVCSATYVQEYRPSGTVIVPRMNCYWRRG
jgi:hypothetical protein